MSRLTSHPRIAVIGAGPAGLSAARRLVELGVRDVTVLEGNATVGGKCCTVLVDGRAHDLGATMGVPRDYDRIVELSDEAGIARLPFPRETCFELGRGKRERLNPPHELPRLLYELGRYFWLHRTVGRGADGSGLHHAGPALTASWAAFARDARIELLSRRTLTYRTGYGYGYDDAVPAVLHANLFRPSAIAGLFGRRPFMWSGGTQPIWTAAAAQLARDGATVRTGASIREIRPTSVGVDVLVEGERTPRRFDRVIAAIDPRRAATLLRPLGAEHRVFAAAVSMPYATVACSVSDLSVGRPGVGYLRANMRREREGHPMAWIKRYADSDVHVFHLFAPPALTDAEIERRIATDVRALGGRLRAVRESRRWEFFPHFSADAAARGAYRDAEALQGARHVYFAGEFFSYATMARAAEHGAAIAERTVREWAARPALSVAPMELAA